MADYFRPILGAKLDGPLTKIRLPCYASYKVDGWRGIWQGLEFISRSGKTIPNRALQHAAATLGLPPGWDGEIIVGEPNARDVFRRTDSFCKRAAAPIPPDGVRFFTFDNAAAPGEVFWRRSQGLADILPFVVRLDQILVESYDQLIELEEQAVASGYEGLVTRSPEGPYKHGRSTLREQYLVKVKRYEDEEVKIVGFEELKHNANPAEVSPTGYTHRSSHQSGKIGGNTLGALIVDWRGNQLRVGTGFTSEDREVIWRRRDDYIGKTATIRYSPVIKDLPRQPVWKGMRNDL